ncbi:MAG TPA: TaqI-like C-terminal specificity domain-containing protein [Polyangiaceae bacterium]|nr:TaqI-like C-terminal specificity domain-containing protein [Polyangiaceae bacterium]
MVATRRVREKHPGPLERLLALLVTLQPRPEPELRALWMRTLLRESSRVLLGQAGFAVPARARLFELTESDARLERALAEHAEARKARDESVAVLLAATPCADLPHALGALFEGLESFEVVANEQRLSLATTRRRKKTGSFFTPAAVAEQVASQALSELDTSARGFERALRVCDPACGAGSFLVEMGRAVCRRARDQAAAAGETCDEPALRRALVERALFGVDLNPIALSIAELALWAFAADPALPASAIGGLGTGDALSGRGFERAAFPDQSAEAFDWVKAMGNARFDLVIGNPPWVAYAGRAAQPLTAARRAFLSGNYRSFRGYPTLHALFVERALELAPTGVVALLVPSPLADLDGYRAVRAVLLETHEPREPLLEFGEDAFASVTQPCFALIARPREARTSSGAEAELGRRFQLAERTRLAGSARAVEPPAVLARLASAEPLPPELFGEFGLQTTRVVSERLLLRAEAPKGAFDYPLLEGREVREFQVGAPRLFLHPDPEVLKAARCRLRARDDYRRVRFVVRQTAKAPIAALYAAGLPFRNTLLAGFEVPNFPPDFVVGLLNSSLYRALHLAKQRDGRQSVFPQVKIAHLRSLPRPPASSARHWHGVSALARSASQARPNAELRKALDHAVFELFDLSDAERNAVLGFLRERAPELLASAE